MLVYFWYIKHSQQQPKFYLTYKYFDGDTPMWPLRYHNTSVTINSDFLNNNNKIVAGVIINEISKNLNQFVFTLKMDNYTKRIYRFSLDTKFCNLKTFHEWRNEWKRLSIVSGSKVISLLLSMKYSRWNFTWYLCCNSWIFNRHFPQFRDFHWN